MGEYVVMPNHFHAMISIGNNAYNTTFTAHKNRFGPQSKNLASIISGFKIGVTKNARIITPIFAWQPRFHEHIIRNQTSHKNISEYIINNALRWNKDTFNHKNNSA